MELSGVITFNSMGFKGWDKYKSMKDWEMCSMSETKIANFMKEAKKIDRIYETIFM